jgi:hypothetical protein
LRAVNTHGLPSLPRTTPLGNFLGGSVLDEAALELEACSSVLSNISLRFDFVRWANKASGGKNGKGGDS